MDEASNEGSKIATSTADADNAEMLIDESRLACEWEVVLSGIKRYAHMFDVGAATSTYQHDTLDSVRAYYWVCMGEATYERKGDYYNAIDCAKRAIVIDPNCVEARVIITRILLEKSGSALRPQTAFRNGVDNVDGLIAVDLDAGNVLQELLQVKITKI